MIQTNNNNNKFTPGELEKIGYEKKYRTFGDVDSRTNIILEDSDKMFLKYLTDMYQILGGQTIDLNKFKTVIEALEELRKLQDKEYLKALMYPEKTRGCKIPSAIPIPSSSFQLKNSFYVTTNALGNACVVCNPYNLASSAGNLSTVYVNNDASLDGVSSSNFFKSVNAGQSIPSVYNQYRLVSASVIAKYVGRLDIVQGLIGGAIVFDQSITPSAIGSINPSLQKYGDFNLAQDAFFQQENYTLQGMREIFFPLDNTWEQYIPVDTSKNGFGFLFYILGAPPSSNIFKFDVYFNMECLPDVTFLNYIPTSVSTAPVSTKNDDIRKAQEKPITTADAVMDMGAPSNRSSGNAGIGGLIGDIAGTIGSLIPGVGQILNLLF